jgi:thermitase
MLAGVALLIASVAGHTFAFTSAFDAVTALTAEFGVGLLLVAGYLSRRERAGKPFFFLGAISLVVCVLLLGAGRFIRTEWLAGKPTSLLLELGPDDRIDELDATLSRYDATYERAFPNFTLAMDEDLAQVYLVTVGRRRADALIKALSADAENVDFVDVNRAFGLEEPIVTEPLDYRAGAVMENDPLVAQQWGLEAIDAHDAHRELVDVDPVRRARVAIVDTGVDAGHEDIVSVFTSSPGGTDLHGHGSHCAGLAGAVTNNGLGIASLNWEGRFVEVSGYKALGDNGMGTIESIAQAVLDATRDDADVISMSLGGKSPTAPKTIVDAIEYALSQGAIVVVSAGNSNEDAIDHMPSNVPGVIVVSAVDENLRKATFSNTNTSLERPIAAPGVNILSLRARGGYVRMSGTSMSTPIVSGLVGVMRSIDPSLSAADVYDILRDTGRDLEESAQIGKLVNASAAINAVQAGL